MPFNDLDQSITQFAAAAVRTQEIFDEAWRQALMVFETMIANSPPEHRDSLRPLVPSRQFLREYQFSFDAVVSQNNLQGFRLQVLPLNLYYSITRQVQRQNHTRFRAFVEQITVQE